MKIAGRVRSRHDLRAHLNPGRSREAFDLGPLAGLARIPVDLAALSYPIRSRSHTLERLGFHPLEMLDRRGYVEGGIKQDRSTIYAH